jgi:hypothetical protein
MTAWDEPRQASARSSMSAAPGPIFLAGVDRSGIGLLGELLEAHPDVAISRRTNFWSYYHGRFGDLDRPENLERCVAEMLRYTRIQALHPDRDALLERVRRTGPTYAHLFAALQEHHLHQVGKFRWGDKSLDSEGYADIIFDEFPDAVMVHVIRDPRDRYASQATHRRAGRGKVGSGIALWLWSLHHARRNEGRHPGRYTVVRYEDLVTRPREVLQQVCAFVGVPFTSEMLEVAADDVGGRPGDPLPRRFTSTSIGRYGRDLTPREIAFIHLVARQRMAEVGYPAAPARLSWRDRLVFCLIDVPLNLLRMGLWWTGRLWAQRRTPRPSARRLRKPERS